MDQLMGDIWAVADEGVEFGRRGGDRGDFRENPDVSQKRRDMGHPREKADFSALPRNDKQRLVTLTRKQRGEMAEAAFLAMAARMGFRVSKPWGESSRYDFIVDNGRRLLRVQVKSAHRAGEWGGYTFHANGNTSCVYRASEIDVLAAYVVPVEAWYLFPVEEFRKYKSMKLFPASRRRRSKFERFREAWWMVM
jgi:PD-(D/E)XK endonuclease